MKYAAAFFFCALFLSCASRPYHKVDAFVEQEKFAEAEVVLEKEKKALYKSDAILYYLDKGMISHYAKEYKESNGLLEKADRAIEDAFTKSITQNIASFILNDNTKDYAGEDYENLYLNIFNALNYYHQNNLEDAMVEIRRMEEKLQALAVKYNVYYDELAKNKETAAASAAADAKDVKINFSNSALARFLGMIFYRANNSYDDARIDRDLLKKAFSEQKEIYPFPVPKTIDGELNIERGMARLNFLSFSGLSPVKTEEIVRVPIFLPSTVNWVKIALPKMIKRPSVVSRIEVVFPGGKREELELLEDIQNVAIETFKKHLGVIKAKSIIRGTTKGALAAGFSEAGGQIADNDGLAGLILVFTGFLMQIFAEASEQADIRVSHYFPAKAYIGALTLKAGVYSFSINYYNAHGGLIASFDNNNVEVKEGKLNLIETYCSR